MLYLFEKKNSQIHYKTIATINSHDYQMYYLMTTLLVYAILLEQNDYTDLSLPVKKDVVNLAVVFNNAIILPLMFCYRAYQWCIDDSINQFVNYDSKEKSEAISAMLNQLSTYTKMTMVSLTPNLLYTFLSDDLKQASGQDVEKDRGRFLGSETFLFTAFAFTTISLMKFYFARLKLQRLSGKLSESNSIDVANFAMSLKTKLDQQYNDKLISMNTLGVVFGIDNIISDQHSLDSFHLLYSVCIYWNLSLYIEKYMVTQSIESFLANNETDQLFFTKLDKELDDYVKKNSSEKAKTLFYLWMKRCFYLNLFNYMLPKLEYFFRSSSTGSQFISSASGHLFSGMTAHAFYNLINVWVSNAIKKTPPAIDAKLTLLNSTQSADQWEKVDAINEWWNVLDWENEDVEIMPGQLDHRRLEDTKHQSLSHRLEKNIPSRPHILSYVESPDVLKDSREVTTATRQSKKRVKRINLKRKKPKANDVKHKLNKLIDDFINHTNENLRTVISKKHNGKPSQVLFVECSCYIEHNELDAFNGAIQNGFVRKEGMAGFKSINNQSGLVELKFKGKNGQIRLYGECKSHKSIRGVFKINLFQRGTKNQQRRILKKLNVKDN